MKKMIKIWVSGILALSLHSQVLVAQKIDEERMTRDIEVAENVLATLIKHEVSPDKRYIGIDVNGRYQEGYGVTFRIPGDYAMPMAFSISGNGVTVRSGTYYYSDDQAPVIVNGIGEVKTTKPNPPAKEKEDDGYKLKEKVKEKRRVVNDSLRDEFNNRMIKASKDFILDYGDLISQLGPNERIVVTNQDEPGRSWYFRGQRTHISVEGTKADVVAFKQGKATREQTLAKLKVVNTETVEVKEPDLELLSSIINRLYRPDLSKTYFGENNIYYERLKDYGVIYYMRVYSSSEDRDFKRFSMPTQGLEDMDQATRNKKVKELYPQFEREFKENILEYGRTLKTLGDEEVLVFNISLTKCEGCGIPSTLELGIKGSVLKDLNMGKIDKAAGMAKFSVKKGPVQ
ncbi:hypothetical protein KK083_11720 [Fulvivirgaceae bacterium PWU4]|uniref:Uncharacterized protein n=1 Tax=Chryseosolibacter histidini TaxID=2782349 RepID=A0AAP2DJJ3_9BACT|nr:hypothetical protein [Chryseosolibacter histidini]MBT1697548.1 hypothetical protein [Chryseosolibacter histidini]